MFQPIWNRLIQKYYSPLSIRQKVSRLFLLLYTVFLILFLLIDYQVSSNILIRKAIDSTLEKIDLAISNLDLKLNEIEANVVGMMTDYDIQTSIASKPKGDALYDYSTSIKIRGTLDRILSHERLMESIMIFDMNGTVFNSGRIQIITPLEYEAVSAIWEEALPQRKKWVDTHLSNYLMQERRQSILSYTQCFYDYRTGKPLGIFIVNVNERIIAETYAGINLGNQGDIFILGKDNNIVSHKDKEQLYESVEDKPFSSLLSGSKGGVIFQSEHGEQLLVYQEYDRLGWTVVGIVPKGEITQDILSLIGVLFLIFLIFLLLLIVFILAISKSITNPISSLVNTMINVGTGDLEARAPIVYQDEVGVLAKEFNGMIDRTEEMMGRLVEEQKDKRRYELSLIQSQVNPHFLYNTLESICGLTELKRYDEVIKMVNNLAQFYQSVLSDGRTVLTIEEEIQIAQKYLDIVRHGLQHPMTCHIHLDENIRRDPILKLTLQPIVENAVQHGLKCIDREGEIIIRGRLEDGKIILTIQDNGPGIPSEKLPYIFDQSAKNGKPHGFGLANTIERIKLYFGEDCGVTIASVYGQGTTVMVTLLKKEFWEVQD